MAVVRLITAIFAFTLALDAVTSAPAGCTVSEADAASTRKQVQDILEHFKQKDPLGLPGVPIPDPLEVESFQEKISGVHMKFNNAKAYKLSKFRIDHVTIDLHTMEISIGVIVPEVELIGSYTLLTLFAKNSGPFTAYLRDVYAESKTKLVIAKGGDHLQASAVSLDLTVGDIDLRFEKLGALGRLFQGMLNLVGPTIFKTFRKRILSGLDSTVATELNAKLKDCLPFKFSHSSAPIDVALQHASRMARKMKYDPFIVPDQQIQNSMLKLNTTGMKLYGLSKVQRGDQVLVTLRNNTLETRIHLATEELSGSTEYDAIFFDWWKFRGEFAFQVDYVKIGVIAQQPLNLDEKLTLKDIDLEIGKVSITPLSDSSVDPLSGSFAERLLQFSVAFISATVRNVLACVAEEPIRQVVQAAIADIDLEKMVYDNLR